MHIETTEEWGSRCGVTAGITDRTVGSLGFWTDEPVGSVMERWRAFRDSKRPGFNALVKAHQVHGNVVVRHEAVLPGWHVLDGADGHATAQRGLLLAVTVADCVPVYLVSRERRQVALLHAGWRGTAAGILEQGVKLLGEQGLSVHLGVAICGDCYEVGPEVIMAVEVRTAGDREHLDLRAALARRAAALGVDDITASPSCSRHDGLFYSHRGGDAGRMVAFLGLDRQP